MAVTKKEQSQLDYSQEVGGQLPWTIPKSLLSAKHTEVGPCGLTTKRIYKTSKKKQAGYLKWKTANKKRNLLKAFYLTKGRY